MKRGLTAGITAIATAALLVGCAADTGNGGDAPEADGTFKITAIIDETGPGGFAGSPSRKGVELAVEEVNAAGGINGQQVVVEYHDSATDATQATSLMTSAVNDPEVDALIYGVIGSTAIGVAPIAQRAEIPLVLLQATIAEAVGTGDYIFRTTYAQGDFTVNVLDYWESEGIKNISIIAHEDSASGMDVVANVIIPGAEARGMTVNDTVLARTTDADYSTHAQTLIAQNPDAVYNQILGTPIVQIVTQLRNLGYEGEIGASVATAGGVLEAAGALADGVVYPNTYTYATDLPAGKAFAENYEAKFGEKANNFAVDGYDAVRLIAAGAEKAGADFTHETLRDGILAVTQEGLTGSPTADPLVFKDRAATGNGILVRWMDGGETIVNFR